MYQRFLTFLCVLSFPSFVSGVTFKIPTPSYELRDNRVKIEGFGSILVPGKPCVPAKSVWLVVPSGSEIISCKVKRKLHPFPHNYSIISIPCKLTEGTLIEDGILDSLAKYKASHSVKGLYPPIGGECLGIKNFLNYELVKVAIFPFAYDTKAEELFYSTNIVIDIDYRYPFGRLQTLVDTTFDDILDEKVINFAQKSKWYMEADSQLLPQVQSEYTIVAPKRLHSIFRDFIEWKKSIGYKVKVVSPDKLEELNPSKYVLIIGEDIETCNAIVGRIPYTDPNLLISILERTIEFELNSKYKRALFVKGISNYENENFSKLPMEDKTRLLRYLESFLPLEWQFDEFSGEIIYGNYTLINFLTLGKQWVLDDNDNVPEVDEIRISRYSLFNETPCVVFSPFTGVEFLKEGAVCIVSPDSFSQYIIEWKDPVDGGNQSFNYWFLKYLIDKGKVGDAFITSKLLYETYFPYDTLNFKIWGDPSLNLYGIPAVDIGIISTPVKWISPDTGVSLRCRVVNCGWRVETSCKFYCEINLGGRNVYTQFIVVDTLKSKEEKLIEFPDWTGYQPGVEYKVRFELFSIRDENPKNDTLSTVAYVATGDFVVVGDSTRVIQSELTKLGYNGIQTEEITSLYQYLQNFGSIFLCDKEIDFLSIIPNIYVEGANIWLSKTLKGKKILAPIEPPISGMGFSFTPPVVEDTSGWFIQEDCVPIFTDSNGRTVGFYFNNPVTHQKIWSTRFKLSEVPESIRVTIIDSVMHYFGLTRRKSVDQVDVISNITLFESSPNPFCNKTNIRFKIDNKTCKINLAVYNLAGTRVKELLNQFMEVGEYEVLWDATDESGKLLVNGVYFLRLQTEEESKLIKLILFR